MDVQHVHGEVVGRQIHGLEHLGQGHWLPVRAGHHLVGIVLQGLLDEAEQVLLVHAGGGVDVGVHLAGVVEVPVGHRLLGGQFAQLVEEDVHLVFGGQVAQTAIAKGLAAGGDCV